MDNAQDNVQDMLKKGEAVLANVGLGGLLDFSFKKFITLGVIKILYILGIAVAVLLALGAILSSLRAGVFAFVGALIVVPIITALWIIYLRVMMELIVVIFRIGENTSIMAGQGSLSSVSPGAEL